MFRIMQSAGRKYNVVINIAGLSMALLAGCGPIYETQYTLQPPATQQGQMCVMQCEQIKNQCRNNEQLRYQNCESQNQYARLELQRCVNAGYSDCYDGTIWCAGPEYDRCDAEHRGCFQNCGGAVFSEQVCIMGCN